MILRSILTISLLIINVRGEFPHPVPTLDDLMKPWVFARASEASTLFIEPHYEGREPYAHLIKNEKSLLWFEFDGTKSRLWTISHHEKNDKELVLYFEDGDRVLIFPYWDIDHCLLMIRFDSNAEENPTRFTTPYQYLPTISYLEGEE